MCPVDFDFDDGSSKTAEVAGTPEGDGDFETDNLPATGQTSAGGQVLPREDDGGVVDPDNPSKPPGLLKKII